MSTTMLLVPLLVLGVVMAFAFAGCAAFSAAPAPPEAEPAPAPAPSPAPAPGPTPTPTPSGHPADTYPKLIKSEVGLRNYWRLGELAGTVATDEEPVNPKDGTYRGTPALGQSGVLLFSNDPNDKAAGLNGADAFVEHAFDTLLNPPAAFTLECWIKPEPVAAGTVSVLIGSYVAQPPFGFVLQIVQTSATQIQAQARIGDGGQFKTTSVDLGDATAHDNWHYVVATYGKDTPADPNRLRIYADGGAPKEIPAGADPPINYIAAQPTTITPPFRIGAGLDETNITQTDPSHFFKGRMDEVALYDRALDAATITKHFTVALSPSA